MKFIPVFLLGMSVCFGTMYAQDKAPRGLTAEEYKIAQAATIEDLDNDTYVKIGEGDYVLDRYEMKSPYVIAGESGTKKRLDLYKLLDRSTMGELGLVVFFTNTATEETVNLVIPNMASAPEVWNMYFEDLYQHDQQEKDVALKMSYVLSKEVAYLIQKSSGVDVSASDQSNADYDFCFPATALVTLADGSEKPISEIKVGDRVVAYEQEKYKVVEVEEIQVHQRKAIPLAGAQLLPVEEITASVNDSPAGSISLVATPNHPVFTTNGVQALADLTKGDQVYRYDVTAADFMLYQVIQLTPTQGAAKLVYNLQTSGSTYLVNGVVVLEK